MADKYRVLTIISVNRGMIPSGVSRCGQAVLAPHSPYIAGVVIQNVRSGNLEFLDEFCAQIVLRGVLHNRIGKGVDNFHNYTTLQHIVESRRTILEEFLSFVTVADLQEYLGSRHIRKAKRNYTRMESLSHRTCLGHYW